MKPDNYPYYGPGWAGVIELSNYRPRMLMSFDDSPSTDAFGRLRTSHPFTLFDQSFNYNDGPLFWEEVLAGSGTADHDYRSAAIAMTVGTADGDSVIRQTKRYWDYQPGKSQFILATFALAGTQDNLIQRVGYFDGEDGVFFQVAGGTASMVVRTSTSGTASDTAIAQSDWNQDKLDGSGPSGYTLDLAQSQILWMDLEWLGVGRVRTGFVIDGKFIVCHQFLHSNRSSGVYMRTAHLPVRYEIVNDGATDGATLNQICTSVVSEGGHNIADVVLAVSNGTTIRTVGTTPLPVLAIRPGTAFPQGGTVPNRESLIPIQYDIFSEDGPVFYEVRLGGTVAGGSWAAVDAVNSGAEVNLGGTSHSGGILVESGYIPGAKTAAGSEAFILKSSLALTLDYAGTAQTELAIVCTRIGATSSDCSCAIEFKEV